MHTFIKSPSCLKPFAYTCSLLCIPCLSNVLTNNNHFRKHCCIYTIRTATYKRMIFLLKVGMCKTCLYLEESPSQPNRYILHWNIKSTIIVKKEYCDLLFLFKIWRNNSFTSFVIAFIIQWISLLYHRKGIVIYLVKNVYIRIRGWNREGYMVNC